MTERRTARATGLGVLLLFLAGAVGCSSGGSARTDYYAARSVGHGAQPGDGSVIGFGPGASDSSWTASLAFVPTGDGGDFAASE